MHSTADHSGKYIGLMSGTSLDGIDAVLIELDGQTIELLAAIEYPLPRALRSAIVDLCQLGTSSASSEPSKDSIDCLATVDRQLGEQFASAVQALLQQANCDSDSVAAIGSHGQTIRHQPFASHPYTLQIGDPNIIAYQTGITTVADFRRKDIAAGGQGAPLAPLFHQAFFHANHHHRAIINIGGIANISYLGSDGTVSGYDIGPGNILMDRWIQQHKQCKYDKDGVWAASGNVIQPLLSRLQQERYFMLPAPKSTGFELFNIGWLTTHLYELDSIPEPHDVQATLLELTAGTIANAVTRLPQSVTAVFVCGGGALNTHLMHRLQALLQSVKVASTAALGIPPQWVEAAGFAWLARQALSRQEIATGAVTGAANPLILGGIYFI